jgi:hypothetical protein
VIGAIRPKTILVAGWCVFMLYAWPGVMTMDSFDQLREGREWYFTDAHPPVMAFIWGIVDRILPGPLGMLILQGTAFLAGVYLILCRAMRPRRAAIVACVVLLFPPVLAPLAVIWKDCIMAGLLVLGIPLVLSENRRVRLLGLALFVLATAFRYNALAATLPLVVLLFEWKPGQRWFVRYGIGAGAWLACVVLAMGLNVALTDKKVHLQAASEIVDITGVLAKVDGTIPDSELEPLLAPTEITVHVNIHESVRRAYKPGDFQHLISGEGALWSVPITEPMPPARRAAIHHAWKTLVANHFRAYLTYRSDTFAELLGLRRKFLGATVVRHTAQYPGMLDYMGVGRGTSRFQEIGESITMWTAKKTRLFRPHLYMILSLVLLIFARRERVVLALLLSGLLIELSMFLLGWTPDFRYSHWLVTCTVLSMALLIARRARSTA